MYNNFQLFEKFECFSSVKEYLDIFERNSSLKKIASTPLVIRMIVSILPFIMKNKYL